MINRKSIIEKHNPKLNNIDTESPLTVGNGEFCFTADVTGFQTLYSEYEAENFPLCTMSQWGWHSIPVNRDKKEYTLDDLEMTEFDYAERKVYYAVDEKEGNEEVYDWLRKNPHRLNLAKIALLYDDKPVSGSQLTEISQELKIYEGILYSDFYLENEPCKVRTACDYDNDILDFSVKSKDIKNQKISIEIEFPYGSHKISGADWDKKDKHETIVINQTNNSLVLKRVLDNDVYYVNVIGDNEYIVSEHKVIVKGVTSEISLQIAFAQCENFSIENLSNENLSDVLISNVKNGWEKFWESGGFVHFGKSLDKRAFELDRRIILSQYLLAIQSAGSIPPQETGLTCNSWYGKFHLEMHFWHSAWIPFFKKDSLLLKSIGWYKKHLQTAKDNAARNGFKGAKWAKMVGPNGIDSPSRIATLLIWQQPHIIYMLESLYENDKSDEFLKEHWDIIKESADYMADLVFFEESDKKYHLIPPIIPAQEEHDPRITKDPTFELEYWKFGLDIASAWAKRLGKLDNSKIKDSEIWTEVSSNLATPPIKDDLYLAHANCPDTFTKFQKDHPSMLGAFGLLKSERMNPETAKKTLEKVLECWNFETMWGWDFAMMAMTALRLGDLDSALDILLKDTYKNQYVTSGNNYQFLREDLPLYLPGNGSLLLAVAMMTADFFPKDENWASEYEDMVAPQVILKNITPNHN